MIIFFEQSGAMQKGLLDSDDDIAIGNQKEKLFVNRVLWFLQIGRRRVSLKPSLLQNGGLFFRANRLWNKLKLTFFDGMLILVMTPGTS